MNTARIILTATPTASQIEEARAYIHGVASGAAALAVTLGAVSRSDLGAEITRRFASLVAVLNGAAAPARQVNSLLPLLRRAGIECAAVAA